jgi:ATP-dependent Clp protease ATP-binding subunit ClpB
MTGEYTDRRFNRAIDCSKTIWVIATNVGSDRITGYYTKHLEKLSEEKRDKADMRPLQAELKRIYRNEFGVRRDRTSLMYLRLAP